VSIGEYFHQPYPLSDVTLKILLFYFKKKKELVLKREGGRRASKAGVTVGVGFVEKQIGRQKNTDGGRGDVRDLQKPQRQ
jgi:hypothetical protein